MKSPHSLAVGPHLHHNPPADSTGGCRNPLSRNTATALFQAGVRAELASPNRLPSRRCHPSSYLGGLWIGAPNRTHADLVRGPVLGLPGSTKAHVQIATDTQEGLHGA